MDSPGQIFEGGLAGTRHVPVLLSACMEALQPGPGKIFVDGTLGGGGHTRALLEAGARVIGLDWDARVQGRTQALQEEFPDTLTRVHAGYAEIAKVLDRLGVAKVHGVLLDLGFSSDQLDDPARGLSYHVDGPLDMRLDSRVGRTVADLLNGESEASLTKILFEFGEEPRARVLAREIVARRKRAAWQTTAQLRALVEEIYPYRHSLQRAHPAARIFQAFRVAVNSEMDQLQDVLPAAAARLEDGGRLAVITFQPMEDRVVKAVFRRMTEVRLDSVGRVAEEAAYKAWKKHEPSGAEVVENPRARSAKLRVLERRA